MGVASGDNVVVINICYGLERYVRVGDWGGGCCTYVVSCKDLEEDYTDKDPESRAAPNFFCCTLEWENQAPNLGLVPKPILMN